MTLSGVYVPLITPFDGEGAVAREALERLAHEVLDAGAQGLVALGTTGEPSSLSTEERRVVVDLIAGVCRERGAQLLVGADESHPGMTAALTVVPPFVRPGEDGVVAHFAALPKPRPIVVYHVPYRTGQQLSADTVRRLAAVDGIIGVKYAAGIDSHVIDLLADPPPNFAVLGGDDVFISPLLAIGAHGGILASAHLLTERFVKLANAWEVGEGHDLARLSQALFAEPNPTVIKGVLHARGRIPTAAVRLPLLPPNPDSVEKALQRL